MIYVGRLVDMLACHTGLNSLLLFRFFAQVGQCAVFLWFCSAHTLVDLRDLAPITEKRCQVGVDLLAKLVV